MGSVSKLNPGVASASASASDQVALVANTYSMKAKLPAGATAAQKQTFAEYEAAFNGLMNQYEASVAETGGDNPAIRRQIQILNTKLATRMSAAPADGIDRPTPAIPSKLPAVVPSATPAKKPVTEISIAPSDLLWLYPPVAIARGAYWAGGKVYDAGKVATHYVAEKAVQAGSAIKAAGSAAVDGVKAAGSYAIDTAAAAGSYVADKAVAAGTAVKDGAVSAYESTKSGMKSAWNWFTTPKIKITIE